MSLLEAIQLSIAVNETPTKKEFGEKMHDCTVSETVKQAILKATELAGGYDCLLDD